MALTHLIKDIWKQKSSVYIAGEIWLNNELLSIDELLYSLDLCNSFSAFDEFVKKLSGQYSIVVEHESSVWIAVDTIARFPLFYLKTENEVVVTDSPSELLKNTQFSKNDEAIPYFLQFGATPFGQTLVKNVVAIEGGSVLKIGDEVEIIDHRSDLFETKLKHEYSTQELSELLDLIFEQYLHPILEKPIVVPLTAGYDSRLILTQLKRKGFENVFCFTWGRAENHDAIVAKQIAEQLGYSYQFIEYNASIVSTYLNDEIFESYVRYVGNLSSMPFLQDYFAVRWIKEKHLVPENAVFIQGHTGDGYAGSHLKPWFQELNRKGIANQIINQFGATSFSKRTDREKVLSILQNQFFPDCHNAIACFDLWDLSSRQAKFIAHSATVFDFFGYDSVLPLSDRAFINYFLAAPLKVRMGENLYRNTLEEFYFKPFGITEPIKQPTNLEKEAFFKHLLKRLMPFKVKQMYYNTNDAIFYNEITSALVGDKTKFKKPKSPINFNSYIIQWYLKFIFQSK